MSVEMQMDKYDYYKAMTTDMTVENDRLQRQVTELQAISTKALEASLPRVVRRFHERFGHPIAHTPAVPDVEQVKFRLRLIAEEFFELLAAAECRPMGNSAGGDLASNIVNDAIHDEVSGVVHMPEFVDALADMAWVIEGTHAVFGVQSGPVLAEVARANMSKGKNGPDGKPVKPAGWQAPNIERVLEEQGWKR